MVMMWPGHLTGNRTYDGMTVSVDLFATMASLVSKVPENLDGVNLMPYLTGEKREMPIKPSSGDREKNGPSHGSMEIDTNERRPA